MAFAFNNSHGQNRLIQRLNHYLRSQGRPTISEEGYCNGLAALYLYAKCQGQENAFFNQFQHILQKNKNDNNPDPLIDRFIEKILALQSPEKSLQGSRQTQLDRSIELIREREGPHLRHEW